MNERGDAVVGEVIAEEVQATEERLRREEREAVSSSEIVRVSPGLAAVADPLWQAARGLPRGLRDVAAGGPELVVLV